MICEKFLNLPDSITITGPITVAARTTGRRRCPIRGDGYGERLYGLFIFLGQVVVVCVCLLSIYGE